MILHPLWHKLIFICLFLNEYVNYDYISLETGLCFVLHSSILCKQWYFMSCLTPRDSILEANLIPFYGQRMIGLLGRKGNIICRLLKWLITGSREGSNIATYHSELRTQGKLIYQNHIMETSPKNSLDMQDWVKIDFFHLDAIKWWTPSIAMLMASYPPTKWNLMYILKA